MLYLSECIALLHGPVLWRYALALTQPMPRVQIVRQGHLLPFGLAVISLLLMPNRLALNQWLGAAGLLNVGGYAVAILRQLNRHEQ
ncbi:hypothetical protein ACS5NO_28275 [Larkinella sp. GY13]|uniref:hypothetical protein n=1 Tax=Larkinella sp. GY13 TaxID=3453720 RepID=UPI003EE91FEC